MEIEQPIFAAKAHIFHIDPHTKRSWLPASCEAIGVNFYYDSARNIYRIISLDGNKAVINSTITPNMTFTKTSQKFGQWSDIRANTVYGLGFASEPELNKFIEKFQEVKEATRATTQHKMGQYHFTNCGEQQQQHLQQQAHHHHNGNLAGNDSPCQSSNRNNALHLVDQEELEPSSLHLNSIRKTPNDICMKKSLVAHQRSQSLSGLQASKAMMDSPKHGMGDKLTSTSYLSGGEAQLRYENDRLKLALAQSSANAKKWEIELQTLKNNNLRLTNALQESTANVEEWKLQLQTLKDENNRMRLKMIELEASQGNPEAMVEFKKEMEGLMGKTGTQEGEIRQKDKQIEMLKESLEQFTTGDGHKVEDKIKVLLNENENLRLQLNRVQDQSDTGKVSEKAKKAMLEQMNSRLSQNIHELRSIQTELTALLNTS